MNEQYFGKRIGETLNQGLDVHPAIESRLARARARALAHHRATAPAVRMVVAGAGGRVWTPMQRLMRIGVPVVILIAGLAGVSAYKQHQQRLALTRQAAEIEEIDARLLTGELPIKAYLDEDFQAWLKRSSE